MKFFTKFGETKCGEIFFTKFSDNFIPLFGEPYIVTDFSPNLVKKISPMRSSLEVTKKVGNILTKFGDFFWESQNLVKNQVINFSPKIVNQDIVEYFSPNLVKISSILL